MLGLARVRCEIINRLLPAPPHRVHARVHHESDGPPHFIRKLAIFHVGICVKAHFGSETFGVKSPALDKRRVAAMLAKFRRILHFLRKRDLQMMSGHSLVQAQRLHFPFGAGV